ncbi:MAG: dual specificity protein phosphatase family protein [Gemmataceae bacterium]
MITFSNKLRWYLGIGIALMIFVTPYFYYRYTYTYAKRLRSVVPGQVYRSGQMTAAGFAEAIETLGIRTVINLQDEYPDPDVDLDFLGTGTIKESAMCRQLGARYVMIRPDLLPRNEVPTRHPVAIDQFLEVMDDPASYPVLIHCRAGLHRTGCLCAVYRMEYQGWSPQHALDEMQQLGFGRFKCSSANDYIIQYVLTYQPRSARGTAEQAEPSR